MNTRGFTLLELILGVVIMAITALAFAPLVEQAVGSYAVATTRSRAVHDIRHAMFQITRELLQVDAGNITGISATQLQFVDDLGANTDYHLNGNSVFRGNTLLAPNVNSLTFTYLDNLGAPTPVIADIRRIGVEMEVNAPGQGAVNLRSEVFPRGFMYTNFQ
jgi:prepilin-type N-terminal cleavage/methylation domain-containing protein